MACIATPLALPFMTFLAIFSAPVVFPIFMASDNVYRRGCPHQSSSPCGHNNTQATTGPATVPE
jgi:hypothetical protein